MFNAYSNFIFGLIVLTCFFIWLILILTTSFISFDSKEEESNQIIYFLLKDGCLTEDFSDEKLNLCFQNFNFNFEKIFLKISLNENSYYYSTLEDKKDLDEKVDTEFLKCLENKDTNIYCKTEIIPFDFNQDSKLILRVNILINY